MAEQTEWVLPPGQFLVQFFFYRELSRAEQEALTAAIEAAVPQILADARHGETFCYAVPRLKHENELE